MVDNETGTNEEEFNENILTFMYQAIADTQSVIRSIDTKLGFILVLNLIPITNIGKIYFKIHNTFFNEHDYCMLLLKIIISIICIACWIIACLCTYRGISAIDNPKDHIRSVNDVSGYFYSSNLYKTNLLDALFNRKKLTSERTLPEYLNQRPLTTIDILKELSFEKMKLAYIRNIKLTRQIYSFKFTVVWVVLGISIYIFL
jgi:hypothetical protein